MALAVATRPIATRVAIRRIETPPHCAYMRRRADQPMYVWMCQISIIFVIEFSRVRCYWYKRGDSQACLLSVQCKYAFAATICGDSTPLSRRLWSTDPSSSQSDRGFSSSWHARSSYRTRREKSFGTIYPTCNLHAVKRRNYRVVSIVASVFVWKVPNEGVVQQ
jgi:hypothetical protein